jgi:hypothetical protein
VPQLLPNARIPSPAATVFHAPGPLRLWHLASLDAPTVALVWSLAFAWVARIRLPLWVPILLALAVWAAYIADRLLDARAALLSQNLHRLRDRHLFHWRHRRILLPLAIASAAAAAAIVFTLMPPINRERNSILAAASLVYLTRVHTGRKQSPFLSKELLVGLLFTAGCALPALTRISAHAGAPTLILLAPLLIPVGFFALLAWLNCHAIDRWEADPHSAAKQRVLPFAALLALAGLLLAALLLNTQPRSAALLATGSAAALLLALLHKLHTRLTPIALRAAADLVLLTPVFLLAFK